MILGNSEIVKDYIPGVSGFVDTLEILNDNVLSQLGNVTYDENINTNQSANGYIFLGWQKEFSLPNEPTPQIFKNAI